MDACLAASFVSWVAESPLTGAGGGGFMLVHTARRPDDSGARLLRRPSPGSGSDPSERVGEMDEVDVEFTRAARNRSSVSAPRPTPFRAPRRPGGAAHRAYGKRPWAELLEPAVRLAREGVVLAPPQAYLHAILD